MSCMCTMQGRYICLRWSRSSTVAVDDPFEVYIRCCCWFLLFFVGGGVGGGGDAGGCSPVRPLVTLDSCSTSMAFFVLPCPVGGCHARASARRRAPRVAAFRRGRERVKVEWPKNVSALSDVRGHRATLGYRLQRGASTSGSPVDHARWGGVMFF